MVRRSARGLAGVLGLLLVLMAPGARADKARDAQRDAARMHYEEGTKAYNLGDFARAIEHYRAAYNALPEAVFLYNIAQSYRLAKDFEQALFFYQSFLRNMPDAANRAEVEARITEMQGALARQAKTAEPPNDTVAPGEQPRPERPRPEPSAAPGATPRIPSPASVGGQPAASPGPGDDGLGRGAAPRRAGRPIYKRWWFWAGLGAAAAGTVAVVALTSGGSDGPPDSHFGSFTIY